MHLLKQLPICVEKYLSFPFFLVYPFQKKSHVAFNISKRMTVKVKENLQIKELVMRKF